MLHAASDWKGINEHIVLLSKRRAQLKQAISAMVKEAITYIDRAPNLEVKTELIETSIPSHQARSSWRLRRPV